MLDFINMKPEKKNQMQYSNYSSWPVEMQLVSSHQVGPESLKIFQPSYASSKAKH